MIIAAFAGVGKTKLAELYPQKVVDFCCMPYKYVLDEDEPFTEENKANLSLEFIFGWQKNYVKAIKQNMSNDKILLIPSDFIVLALLKKEGIPYILCYPKRDAKEVYHKRFLNRGNSENFIDIFIGGWDKFMDALENDCYGRHIVLEPNQFLSDVINVDALLADTSNELNELKTIPAEVAAIIPLAQLMITKNNLSAYQDGIERLTLRLQNCPNIGETDNMKEHPAVFHYFYASTDFYICEYDRKKRMFGYAILNGDLDNSEWGYFAVSDLTNIPQLNIDYHFEEQSIEAALYTKYPKYFRKLG